MSEQNDHAVRELPNAALVQLQTILREAADGIIVVDDRGTIESSNPAAAAMFGYEAGDLASGCRSALTARRRRGSS